MNTSVVDRAFKLRFRSTLKYGRYVEILRVSLSGPERLASEIESFLRRPQSDEAERSG